MIINIFSFEEYMKDPGCLDFYFEGDNSGEENDEKLV